MVKRATPILLLILILSPIMHANPIAAQEKDEPRSVTVYIPAVIIHKDTNETVLVKADVSVRNGTGQVSITGTPVDRLFRLSVETSAIVSSFIYNFDYWKHDYNVDLSLNKTTYVAGPSGGLALALAFYVALADAELDERVITSGMINPDGTIGQVAYIKEKARGVADYFNRFLLPLDQDVSRTNVTTEKRIGPYPIGITRMIVEQLDLDIGNMTSHTVGSIFEALDLSLELDDDRFMASPNMPQINDENLTMVAREIYNMLLYETLKKSDELKSTMDLLIFRSRALEFDVNSTLETADAIIALSWLSQKEGSIFASTEILLQAYLRLKYVEYLLGLLLNDFRTELIEQDVGSEVRQAYMLMNETEVSSIEGMKTKAYAKMLLTEAAGLYYTAEPALKYIYLARADKILRVTQEGAVKMAQAKTMAKKSTLLQTLASSMNGTFSVGGEDPHVYARRYVQAVRSVYLYTYEVSLASGVLSPFIAQASLNLWRAESNVEQDPLLAMTYATETYFYISTYMALHPGYVEISNYRLPYIQNTTWSMLELNGELNTPLVPWTFNQFADALSTNNSRIMSYEKALSYLILDRVLARDYKTGEIYTNYQDWLVADEDDVEPPQQVTPWINFLTSLIPMVLLGSAVSFSGRITPLKRFVRSLFHSGSNKEADKRLS
ncbi:MAG: hypothetical protein ACE5KU_02135 [Nitrososphaerales archaeon]